MDHKELNLREPPSLRRARTRLVSILELQLQSEDPWWCEFIDSLIAEEIGDDDGMNGVRRIADIVEALSEARVRELEPIAVARQAYERRSKQRLRTTRRNDKDGAKAFMVEWLAKHNSTDLEAAYAAWLSHPA